MKGRKSRDLVAPGTADSGKGIQIKIIVYDRPKKGGKKIPIGHRPWDEQRHSL